MTSSSFVKSAPARAEEPSFSVKATPRAGYVGWIQECRNEGAALIIESGRFTATLRYRPPRRLADFFEMPIVECHLSNPAAREDFRRSSYVSLAATGVISGFGPASYQLAVDAVCTLADAR